MWGLLLTTILVGIILAWFYANTKGSIFAAMLGHTMFNWSNWVFPALKLDSAALILFGLYFLVVGIYYLAVWKKDLDQRIVIYIYFRSDDNWWSIIAGAAIAGWIKGETGNSYANVFLMGGLAVTFVIVWFGIQNHGHKVRRSFSSIQI